MPSRKRTLPGATQAVAAAKPAPPEAPEGRFAAIAGANELRWVPVDSIIPDPNQPRRFFDDDELEGLAATIREQGVINPPEVVDLHDGRYMVVAGERRWRAASLAEQPKLQVLVRPERPPLERLKRQVIENVTRSDLTAIEEADSIYELVHTHGLTEEQVAKQVGRTVGWVSQRIVLLKLPGAVQELIGRGKITFAHARELNTVDDNLLVRQLAERVVAEELSSRQLKELVEQHRQNGGGERERAPRRYPTADRDHLARELETALETATGLDFKVKGSGGQITISYTSDAEGARAFAEKLGATVPDPIA